MKRYASLLVIPLLASAFVAFRPATAGVSRASDANSYVCNYRGKKGFTYPGYGATQADALRSASETCRSAGDSPCYFISCQKQ